MRERWIVALSSVLAFSMACGPAGLAGPQDAEIAQVASDFSAEATSPATVTLQWPAETDAVGYLLEGRYGDGDFFQVAQLAADQTEFTHFVVPGSTQIAYRLNAVDESTIREIGSALVAIPELSASPLTVDTLLEFTPTVGPLPELSVFPTIDPMNPDMNAIATIQAMMDESLDAPAVQPQASRVEAHQEIGPEGGSLTVTSPDGAVYLLEVPPGAVADMVTFRLIPIESMPELPFAGGLLAGVRIEPPFPVFAPLVLSITLPPDSTAASVPVTGLTVSSFSHELSLAPAYPDGANTFRMVTSWGDTLGLVSATPADVAAQAARIPTDPSAQMAQQLAALRLVDPDSSPEANTRLALQVVQGFLQRTGASAAVPASGRRGLAAPVPGAPGVPAAQYQTPLQLLSALFWAEAVWNWLQQMLNMVPGAPPPPGELGAALVKLERATVEQLVPAIKDFMDDHDGCRSFLGLYAETFRQILRTPATPYQQALANYYRAQFGPPPSPQCDFRFQIVRSSIKETVGEGADEMGVETIVATVHSEPWPLQLAFRDMRYFLSGPVGVLYDDWHSTFSKCPPTTPLRPFPTSLIWITELAFVFDADDIVSDFALKQVELGSIGTNFDSELSTDLTASGRCTVLRNFHGINPVDDWGVAFAGLHTYPRGLDNWVITGDDSYVATDTITGRVEGPFTEDASIVLTVTEK